MLFNSLFASWRRRTAPARRKAAHTQLAVEGLEERAVPSSMGLLVKPQDAGLFAPPPAAHQVTVPIKEHCRGTLVDVVPGTLHFAGQGVATHLGRYSITGSNDFDDQGNVLNGQFTSVTADGSTISGIYSGTYTVLEDGRIRFDVHVNWLAGTGRLEGVTGEAEVVAFLDAVAPGAAFEYFTDGTLTFQK